MKTKSIKIPYKYDKKKLKDLMSYHLEICLSCKGAILYIADFILREVEVRQIGKAIHGAEKHSFQLVLVQSQVMHRVVDVLGYSLIGRLVLTAYSQPNIAFVPFNEPAVPSDHVGEIGQQ